MNRYNFVDYLCSPDATDWYASLTFNAGFTAQVVSGAQGYGVQLNWLNDFGASGQIMLWVGTDERTGATGQVVTYGTGQPGLNVIGNVDLSRVPFGEFFDAGTAIRMEVHAGGAQGRIRIFGSSGGKTDNWDSGLFPVPHADSIHRTEYLLCGWDSGSGRGSATFYGLNAGLSMQNDDTTNGINYALEPQPPLTGPSLCGLVTGITSEDSNANQWGITRPLVNQAVYTESS